MFVKSLYVQIAENKISVRSTARAHTYEAIANPGFSHPRMLIGDFSAAQACLKSLVGQARGADGFTLKTLMLIHPMETLDGGLCPLEERVLRELALSAGAAKLVIWTGAVLSDADVMTMLKK